MSGVVRVVGAGVPAEWLGRRVSSFVTGSCAERAVAPVSALTAVPDPLDLLPAAALVHDGVTALGLLGLTALGETDRVLALGASGGMGTLLVQPTQARGARVIAVARGEEKLALVRELGADAAVDATRDDWAASARHALGGRSRGRTSCWTGWAVPWAPPPSPSRPTVAASPRTERRREVSHPLDTEDAARRAIGLFGIADVQFDPADLNRLTSEAHTTAATGRLRPVIGGVFPLARAAEAHAAIEGRGLVGKVMLRV
ncbi:zinc-binding dehydrogenase [Streptomyces sp. NBC_01715]|uniref:zinc-binding dehydrogenase n=1 Tax=Streptomyces sp. NBC_01715 TaxID=2975916 RepID=UPI002E34E8C0|nr:zinc-binding dehydrogenase [Streptomyces sp. NBC_01715]